jgi:resuscitation-promoting factor RpfB
MSVCQQWEVNSKMPVKGGYLIVAGGGAILLWSGIKGHKWSTVIRDVLSGQRIPSTQELAITTSSAAYGYGGANSSNITGDVGGSVTKNKTIGAALAAVRGWGPGTSNWTSLVALWTRESGWDNHARNPSSGAYGIPQALPASKMGPAANPPLSSATAQILWGLSYIAGRYGNPNNAEAHENANGWY